MLTPDTLHTPSDVSAYAAWLFGRSFEPRPGLVHVVSVERQDDALFVLRIRDDTPRSPHDACMLRMARARADAIITTAKVLRDEPDLRHELDGSPVDGSVLRTWGDRARGRLTPRVSIVLTAGTGFVPDHPLVGGDTRVVVACPRERANSLRMRFAGANVLVVGLEHSTVSEAARLARCEFAAQTVLLEAGPATARALYGPADGPNELMLAEFEGPVAPAVRGGRLVDRRILADLMGPFHYGPNISSENGSWRFAWLERRSIQDG